MAAIPEIPQSSPVQDLQDWFDIKTLLHGSSSQQAAYRSLLDLQLFPRLHVFNPVLAGSFPLQLNIPDSDLDILCEAHDRDKFADCLFSQFGVMPGFRFDHRSHQGLSTIICRFQFRDIPIEIFGQPLPVYQQRAFQHLLIESRLLSIGGPMARQAILEMKKSGIKTEPAFARYFNLTGDPYQALLDLTDADISGLQASVQG